LDGDRGRTDERGRGERGERGEKGKRGKRGKRRRHYLVSIETFTPNLKMERIQSPIEVMGSGPAI